MVNSETFWRSGGKHPFGCWEKEKKKRWIFRGIQVEDRQIQSAAVYTMDWPGPVICMYVLVCVGTMFHEFTPTDILVVVRSGSVITYKLFFIENLFAHCQRYSTTVIIMQQLVQQLHSTHRVMMIVDSTPSFIPRRSNGLQHIAFTSTKFSIHIPASRYM
jgi:hypothetical protein